MPIYVYHCNTCGRRVELILPYMIGTATPERELRPACGWDGCEGRLERQPTSAAVHFKGSGWTERGK